jgi:hypothetical protein
LFYKVEAIQRLGCEMITVSYDTWWSTMVIGHFVGLDGTFIHPVCNYDVIAGKSIVMVLFKMGKKKLTLPKTFIKYITLFPI